MRPANYIPVSRAQIMAFLERAILDAAQRGFDRESGFKVIKAVVTEDTQSVRVDLDNTDFFFIDIEHLVPRGDW
jgi:hypothetical protein